MTRPPDPRTPRTRASRPPNRPKAPTTPPIPGVPALDEDSLSPAGERGGHGPRRVTLAAIAGAHGITGEVRLKLFTDDLTPYKRFNDGALTLKSLRIAPNGAIARFAEIPDRTAAERMRGTELTVARDELPSLEEGEFYHADLIGLPCDSDAGDLVGQVAAVENFGAGDILDIEKPDGKRFMVPVAAVQVGERVVVDPAFID